MSPVTIPQTVVTQKSRQSPPKKMTQHLCCRTVRDPHRHAIDATSGVEVDAMISAQHVRVREQGVDHESSRRRPKKPSGARRVVAALHLDLVLQGSLDVDVARHQGLGDARVLVLELRVVVVGHLAVQFVVALVEAELQAQDPELPGQAKVEAVFQLLHNF